VATARIVDPNRWELLGNQGKRPAHIAVQVNDYYAVSPDGWGAYYYDTLEELIQDYIDLEESN
jgi:hypothetical protein